MSHTLVGSATGSAVNGGDITITLPSSAMLQGDYVLVSFMGALNQIPPFAQVTSSSSSVPYVKLSEDLVTPASTNNNIFSVFRRVMPSAVETQVRCYGTGTAEEANTAVAFIFRGADPAQPEDVTTTSTVGTGDPDSPSITVVSTDIALVSCMGTGQILQTSTAITAPTSFIDAINIVADDTFPTAAAMAWISNPSTGAFDPSIWTVQTGHGTVTWGAATVALRAAPEVAYTFQDLTGFIQQPDFIKTDILGY